MLSWLLLSWAGPPPPPQVCGFQSNYFLTLITWCNVASTLITALACFPPKRWILTREPLGTVFSPSFSLLHCLCHDAFLPHHSCSKELSKFIVAGFKIVINSCWFSKITKTVLWRAKAWTSAWKTRLFGFASLSLICSVFPQLFCTK